MQVEFSGKKVDLPKEYEPHFREGLEAGRKRQYSISSNPYQSQYSETGAKDDLWKAVAWAHGFMSALKSRIE
jgi:hypothetical protein